MWGQQLNVFRNAVAKEKDGAELALDRIHYRTSSSRDFELLGLL
jgi:hypothetical protein